MNYSSKHQFVPNRQSGSIVCKIDVQFSGQKCSREMRAMLSKMGVNPKPDGYVLTWSNHGFLGLVADFIFKTEPGKNEKITVCVIVPKV